MAIMLFNVLLWKVNLLVDQPDIINEIINEIKDNFSDITISTYGCRVIFLKIIIILQFILNYI